MLPGFKPHPPGLSLICFACSEGAQQEEGESVVHNSTCQKKEEGESVVHNSTCQKEEEGESVVHNSTDADSIELDGFVIKSTKSACSTGTVRRLMTWTAPSASDVFRPLESYPTLVQYFDKLKSAGYDSSEAITTAGKDGLIEDVPGMKPGHARLIIHLFMKKPIELSSARTKKIPSAGETANASVVEPMNGKPSRTVFSL